MSTSSVFPELFIVDSGNNVIRSFSSGKLTTIAGTGTAGYTDGPGASAQFDHPTGIGNFNVGHIVQGQLTYVFLTFEVNDAHNYVVRGVKIQIQPTYSVTVNTAAGNHKRGYVDGTISNAEFKTLGSVHDVAGTTIYIADSENHVIRYSTTTGIGTYAGTGSPGFVNGPKASAQFFSPTGMTWDSAGNMYVADMGNNVIRKIDTIGNVTTFAGSGQPGLLDGTGTSAKFTMPCAIVFNPADNYLYVADSMNSAIRKISLSGVVTTYTGGIPGGYANGNLTQAKFQCPMDLLIRNGFMYVSDSMNNAIRAIDMVHGAVSTFIN
jgi:hypothetical protein